MEFDVVLVNSGVLCKDLKVDFSKKPFFLSSITLVPSLIFSSLASLTWCYQ